MKTVLPVYTKTLDCRFDKLTGRDGTLYGLDKLVRTRNDGGLRNVAVTVGAESRLCVTDVPDVPAAVLSLQRQSRLG